MKTQGEWKYRCTKSYLLRALHLKIYVSIPGRAQRFFSSPKHAQRICNPPFNLPRWYWDCVFPGDCMDREVNLTTRRHLLPQVKNNWSKYTPTHAFMESTGTTLYRVSQSPPNPAGWRTAAPCRNN